MTNSEIFNSAQKDLSGNWTNAAIIGLIYFITSSALHACGRMLGAQGIFNIIIEGPLALGLAIYGLAVVRKQTTQVGQLFEGFNHFLVSFVAMVIMAILVILGLCLFIVPGIVLALGLSMTYYIIADNPGIDAIEALKRSYKMMDGYKAKYFRLALRFLGLVLLCILTLGIGFIFLIPFTYVCGAKFYEDIKGVNVA